MRPRYSAGLFYLQALSSWLFQGSVNIKRLNRQAQSASHISLREALNPSAFQSLDSHRCNHLANRISFHKHYL